MTMTIRDLDRKDARVNDVRARWEASLVALVRAKVSDAHGHALKALTEALRRVEDGRASILHLNRSPSFKAALGRLDELWEALAGPSEVSLRGRVRDAREAVYREAARHWHPLVPEAIRSRPYPEPTAAQVRQIRAAAVHGYDPRRFLEKPILAAKVALKADLERAGRQGTTTREAEDILAAWGAKAANSIAAAVTSLLGDSTVYADREAGRDLIHPDYLGGVADEMPEES